MNPNDVLFGRGSGPNDHEGNIRFRDLVNSHKEAYMSTSHRQTKSKVARKVVDAIYEINGRFLKRMDAKDARRLGIPHGDDAYCIVEDAAILEKAKQALRQHREKPTKARGSPSGSPKMTGSAKNDRTIPVVSMTDPSPATPPFPQAGLSLPNSQSRSFHTQPSQQGISHDPHSYSLGMMSSGDLNSVMEAPPNTTPRNYRQLPQDVRILQKEMPLNHHDHQDNQRIYYQDQELVQEHRPSFKVSDLVHQKSTSSSSNCAHDSNETMGTFSLASHGNKWSSTDTMGTMEPTAFEGQGPNPSVSSVTVFKNVMPQDDSEDADMEWDSISYPANKQDTSRFVGQNRSSHRYPMMAPREDDPPMREDAQVWRPSRNDATEVSVSFTNADAVWDGNFPPFPLSM